jgi:hypothetical protein
MKHFIKPVLLIAAFQVGNVLNGQTQLQLGDLAFFHFRQDLGANDAPRFGFIVRTYIEPGTVFYITNSDYDATGSGSFSYATQNDDHQAIIKVTVDEALSAGQPILIEYGGGTIKSDEVSTVYESTGPSYSAFEFSNSSNIKKLYVYQVISSNIQFVTGALWNGTQNLGGSLPASLVFSGTTINSIDLAVPGNSQKCGSWTRFLNGSNLTDPIANVNLSANLGDVFYRSASWSYSTSNTDLACDVTQTINFLTNNLVFDRYRYGHPSDGAGIWKEGNAAGTTWQFIDGSASSISPDWGRKTQVRRVDIYESLSLGSAFNVNNPPGNVQTFICAELNIIDTLTTDGVTVSVLPNSVLTIAERLNMTDHNAAGTESPKIALKSAVDNTGKSYFAQIAPTNAELNGTFRYDLLISEREWHHMNSPISTPLSNVKFFTPDANGNATTTVSPYAFSYTGGSANIYRWNASGAEWLQTSAATDFNAETFTIFFPLAQLPVVMRVEGPLALKDQNLFQQKTAVNGNAGTNTSSGFGAPDWMNASNRNGWNMYGNPYLSFINVNRLVSNYSAELQDVAATVYAYQPFKNSTVNGANYFNHNGSTGDNRALNIPPFQAFFQQHITAATNGSNNGSGNNNKGTVYSKRIRAVGAFETIKFKTNGANGTTAIELFTTNAATPNNTLYLDLRAQQTQMVRDYYNDARFNGSIQHMFGIFYDSACFSIKTAPLVFDSLTQKVVVVYKNHGATFRIQNHADFDPAFDSYLYDRYTQTMHNLSAGPYVFTNDTTIKDYRFDWFLVNKTLGVDTWPSAEKQPWIWWSAVGPEVKLFTTADQQDRKGHVVLYDLAGKKLFESTGLLHNMVLPNQSSGTTALLVIDHQVAFKVQFP